MSKLKQTFPLAYQLFMKIAEPRIVRLFHFGIYILMICAGGWAFNRPPHGFEHVLGQTLLYILGGFIITGAILCALAVLPGVWWLERTGLYTLITGMAMYVVVSITISNSVIDIIVSTALIMSFILRWIEIRRYQLAPREE